MKKEVIIGMGMILLIGIVSAGLIEYYGQINQMVEVEGLVFYASDGHLSGTNQKWNLSIGDYVYKSDSSKFSDGRTKWFISKPLEIDSFYNANYNIFLDLESDNERGFVTAELWFVEENHPYSGEMLICSANATSSIYTREVYELSCVGDSLVVNSGDRFALKLIANNSDEDIGYNIYIQGKTKIEVSPI